MQYFDQTHNPDFCESFSGHRIYVNHPHLTTIDVVDIAHGLSQECRFGSQCLQFYSVAEHSILVYLLVKQHTEDLGTLRVALMHDAAEAYLKDFPRPHKVLLREYKELETRWFARISDVLGLSPSADHQLIKEADNHALKLEAARLMRSGGRDWNLPETRPFTDTRVGSMHFYHTPEQIKAMFLRTWDSLL